MKRDDAVSPPQNLCLIPLCCKIDLRDKSVNTALTNMLKNTMWIDGEKAGVGNFIIVEKNKVVKIDAYIEILAKYVYGDIFKCSLSLKEIPDGLRYQAMENFYKFHTYLNAGTLKSRIERLKERDIPRAINMPNLSYYDAMSTTVKSVLDTIEIIKGRDITDGGRFSRWLNGEVEKLKEFLDIPPAI